MQSRPIVIWPPQNRQRRYWSRRGRGSGAGAAASRAWQRRGRGSGVGIAAHCDIATRRARQPARGTSGAQAGTGWLGACVRSPAFSCDLLVWDRLLPSALRGVLCDLDLARRWAAIVPTARGVRREACGRASSRLLREALLLTSGVAVASRAPSLLCAAAGRIAASSRMALARAATRVASITSADRRRRRIVALTSAALTALPFAGSASA